LENVFLENKNIYPKFEQALKALINRQ